MGSKSLHNSASTMLRQSYIDLGCIQIGLELTEIHPSRGSGGKKVVQDLV